MAIEKVTFWRLIPSKLHQELSKDQIFKSLWSTTNNNNQINAPTTLPLSIKSRSEIFQEVQLANASKSKLSLKFQQTVQYSKVLWNFYKTGIINVWRNHGNVSQIKRNLKLSDQVNNKGDTIDMKIPHFSKLSQIMAQTIYIDTIENQTYTGNIQSNVVKHNEEPKQLTPNLFKLTRSQWQLLKRTPRDFRKLPMFAVIFAIFMECTPLLCYLVPEITPLTCTLPSITPRIWPAKNSELLNHITKQQLETSTPESMASKTAYNLSLPQVQSLCKALNLVSKYIPIQMYPQSLLQDKLQNHYNYLVVDNYYLTGLNGNGNIWNLDRQELVMACLERNLILDLTTSDSNLRLKLLKFIMDFPNFNIGYLTVVDLIEAMDESEIMKLRANR